MVRTRATRQDGASGLLRLSSPVISRPFYMHQSIFRQFSR